MAAGAIPAAMIFNSTSHFPDLPKLFNFLHVQRIRAGIETERSVSSFRLAAQDSLEAVPGLGGNLPALWRWRDRADGGAAPLPGRRPRGLARTHRLRTRLRSVRLAGG